MKKILVAMSGGVDSTVVAYLLKKEGYYVEGVYMKLHNSPLYHEKNISNIKKVTSYLDIPYHILDLSNEFDTKVFQPFIKTYKDGLTPNPCVVCNRFIKLGALVDFANKRGFDKLATGHYAKIKDNLIQEAYDKSKDQSYFLANVKKESLKKIIFPLGDMLKDDVKGIASNIEVLNDIAKQKESSEICFVEDSYIDILKDHMDIDRVGDVLDKDGNVIGEHKGYMHYTIGQRKGFRLKVAHEPHYVLDIDAKNNTITVGKREDLDVREFEIENVHLFTEKKSFECEVKIRYKSPKIPAVVDVKGQNATITLTKDIQGLAPGQAAVFYDDDLVIGSGWIKKEIR